VFRIESVIPEPVKALSTGTKTVKGPGLLKTESSPVLFIRLTNTVVLVAFSSTVVIVLLPGVIPDDILVGLQPGFVKQRITKLIRRPAMLLDNLSFIKRIDLKFFLP
jgi:hypothetical protein